MRERSTQTGPAEAPSEPVARAVSARPYRKPVLERLGSVRELTLGGTGGSLEASMRRVGM